MISGCLHVKESMQKALWIVSQKKHAGLVGNITCRSICLNENVLMLKRSGLHRNLFAKRNYSKGFPLWKGYLEIFILSFPGVKMSKKFIKSWNVMERWNLLLVINNFLLLCLTIKSYYCSLCMQSLDIKWLKLLAS